MGFFTKLKNLLTGKGWTEEQKKKEETKKEPETNKEKEELPYPDDTTIEYNKEKEEQEQTKEEEIKEEEPTIDEETQTYLGKEYIDPKIQQQRIKEKEDTTQKEVKETTKGIKRSKKEKEILREIEQATKGLLATTPVLFTGSSNGWDYERTILSSIIRSGAKIDPEIADLIYKNKEQFRDRFTTEIKIQLDNGQELRIANVGLFPKEAYEAIEEAQIEQGQEVASQWWHTQYEELKKRLKEKGATDTAATQINNNEGRITEIRYELRFQ